MDECAGFEGALYVVRLDGRGLRHLRDGDAPAVAPNRTRIAYADSAGSGGIVVMAANGTHVRHVSHGLLDGAPAWAPSGRKLVFVRTVSPAPSGALFASTLYVVNADGTGLRRLVRSKVDNPGPSWVDGRRILVTAGWGQLAIISATSDRVERRIPLPRKGSQVADESPAISPSHREIAYVECDGPGCYSSSVDVITFGGRLLYRIRGAHTPAWTPQGKLLYACCQQAGISGNTSEIVMRGAQHGQARAITPSARSADEPSWLG